MQTEGITVIGSCVAAKVPEDLALFFANGILVDRRNGTPMEMDGYSLYLALKALEMRTGRDYSVERRALVDAVLHRMSACNGFWRHGAWTGSDSEIHLRFTAAAIRLLAEGLADGLVSSASIPLNALRKHLAYRDILEMGNWFLHDSLESPASNVAQPAPHTRNRAWSSSPTNCLVLNTHIDTLITIFHVLRRVGMPDAARRSLRQQLESGLGALHGVLDADQGIPWRVLTSLDSRLRAGMFRTYSPPRTALWKRAVRGVLVRGYFPLRQRLRARYPGFVWDDGYLERDISLRGLYFEYHVANLYDLSILLIQLKRQKRSSYAALADRCAVLIDRGIDYVIESDYWTFLLSTTTQHGKAILLCEAIIARLGTRSEAAAPQRWISAYCRIRRLVPPSPALLGYDPLVVNETVPAATPSIGFDIGTLANARRFTIDIENERCVIEHAASNDARCSHCEGAQI